MTTVKKYLSRSFQKELYEAAAPVCIAGVGDAGEPASWIVIEPNEEESHWIGDEQIAELRSAASEYWTASARRHAQEIVDESRFVKFLGGRASPYIGLGGFRSDAELLEEADFEPSAWEAISRDWERVGANLTLASYTESRKLSHE